MERETQLSRVSTRLESTNCVTKAVGEVVTDIRWYAFEVGQSLLPSYCWLGTLHARSYARALAGARHCYQRQLIYVVSVLDYEAGASSASSLQIRPPLVRGVWWSPAAAPTGKHLYKRDRKRDRK